MGKLSNGHEEVIPCENNVQYTEKVTKMRQIMKEIQLNPLEELTIIDAIQRLGINHVFRREIWEFLHHQYVKYCSPTTRREKYLSHDLHQTSLRFRLLREEGYNIMSTDTFEDFMQKEGKFDEELGKDTLGLLSLFEASHMSMEEEKILDEAKAFSEHHLRASMESLNSSTARLVRSTLKYPHHMTLARFKAEDYVHQLKNAKGWREDLAEVATMEFDRARITYKNEIDRVFKWWKELGLTMELKSARDQPVQWHMWSIAALSDLALSEERVEMTKPTSLIYIIDDIFDVYGQQEDLCLFVEAVNRWELPTLEKLPGYMEKCLKALFDVTAQINQRIWVKFGFNPKDHLQKAWTDLFNAYLVESKWFGSGYLPTTHEYINIGMITCGANVALVHMFFLLGEGLDSRYTGAILYNDNYASIMSCVATILRLWNDLGRAKDEDQSGHDGSYIKCYMKENQEISIDVAKEHVATVISDTWKRLNGHCLRLPPYPNSSAYTFKEGCLNLARMVLLMYDYDKNRNLPSLEEFRQSLLNL